MERTWICSGPVLTTAQKESCEPGRTRSFRFRIQETPLFRLSNLRVLLELVDQTHEQAMAIIEDLVNVAVPDVVLVLDEEVIVRVQFITQTYQRTPEGAIAVTIIAVDVGKQNLYAGIRDPLVRRHEVILGGGADAIDIIVSAEDFRPSTLRDSRDLNVVGEEIAEPSRQKEDIEILDIAFTVLRHPGTQGIEFRVTLLY